MPNNNSSVITNLLYPEEANRKRAAKKRRGPAVNHHRQYLQNLREIQNENRRFKEREAYESGKKKFKLKKFRQVKSVLKEELNEQEKTLETKKQQYLSNRTESVSNLLGNQSKQIVVNLVPEDATEQKNAFLKKGTARIRQENKQEKLHMQNKENALLDNLQRTKRGQKAIDRNAKKPSIPSTAPAPKAKRDARNFLQENFRTVKKHQSPKKPLVRPAPSYKSYGKVPAYLKNYKKDWDRQDKEARERAAQKKDCPPGMTLMSNEERLETLGVLQDNKKKINQQLVRMPIVIDTLGLRKKKAALEEKLVEIDSAIKLFSRERVFIHD